VSPLGDGDEDMKGLKKVPKARFKMYITQEELKKIEQRYGQPIEIPLEVKMGEDDFQLLKESQHDGRAHDVTLFILMDKKVVVIQKHFHPEGVYRPPSGAIKPNESFEEGAKREAREETGLQIKLVKYVLRMKPTFIHDKERIPWTSHVFLARKVGGELKPQDTKEIREVKLVTIEELQNEIRARMLKSGSGGLRYRAYLADIFFEELRRSGLL